MLGGKKGAGKRAARVKKWLSMGCELRKVEGLPQVIFGKKGLTL